MAGKEAECGNTCVRKEGRKQLETTMSMGNVITHTWSVSVIVWIGQAASVFHKKLTTHSQLKVNMGWAF